MKRGTSPRKSRKTRLILGFGISLGLVLLLNGYSKNIARTTDQVRNMGMDTTSSPDVDDLPFKNIPAPKKGEAKRNPLPLHRSLIGTRVNGEIKAGSDGKLLIHRNVRRVFDYYLSLRGRLTDAEIRLQLIDYLQQSKNAAIQDEVLALFDQYIHLLNAETPLLEQIADASNNTVSTFSQMLDERQRLRREYLGDTSAEAFFADQETYEKYQLDRLRIGLNKDLSEAEKTAALAEAELILSPEQREQRHKTFSYLEVKNAPRDEHTTDVIREKFGDDAVDRMAVVEQEKKDWDKKRQDYLDAKSRIQKRQDLNEEEKAAEWAQYLQQNLSSSDLRRMEALDSDSAPDKGPLATR